MQVTDFKKEEVYFDIRTLSIYFNVITHHIGTFAIAYVSVRANVLTRVSNLKPSLARLYACTDTCIFMCSLSQECVESY